MQTTTLRLYQLNYSEVKTYLMAFISVLGNLVLPQLAHLVPQGGLIFLPIYFFTLIAAYKYGWKVGLLTAVFSPLVNHALFGMPPAAVLPAILIKSIFLAITAGLAAHYFRRISIPIMVMVVSGYQLFGTIVEWIMVGDLWVALQDFRIGVPGILFQIIGGFLLIRYLLKE